MSRNRQLSTFNNIGRSARRLSYNVRQVRAVRLKLNGAFEYTRFKSGTSPTSAPAAYGYAASVIQLYLSATY